MEKKVSLAFDDAPKSKGERNRHHSSLIAIIAQSHPSRYPPYHSYPSTLCTSLVNNYRSIHHCELFASPTFADSIAAASANLPTSYQSARPLFHPLSPFVYRSILHHRPYGLYWFRCSKSTCFRFCQHPPTRRPLATARRHSCRHHGPRNFHFSEDDVCRLWQHSDLVTWCVLLDSHRISFRPTNTPQSHPSTLCAFDYKLNLVRLPSMLLPSPPLRASLPISVSRHAVERSTTSPTKAHTALPRPLVLLSTKCLFLNVRQRRLSEELSTPQSMA